MGPVVNVFIFCCALTVFRDCGATTPALASSQKIMLAKQDQRADENALDLDDVYGHCGKLHKCYGVPEGCVANKTCLQLISYGAANGHGRIPIQLYGTAPNSTYGDNFWIGFGASSSGGMDNTAVIQCARYSNDSSEVVAAFNSANHTYQTLVDRHNGISGQKSRFHKGYLSCAFQLEVQRNVMGNAFNLSNPYFLLLGAGWINQTAKNTFELKWHLVKPSISASKIVFACGNKCADDDYVDVDLTDIYGRCGRSHKCYGVPADCVENKSCLQLISYGAANRHGKIPIELYGTAPNSTYAHNFWVGFGASSSGSMDDTAVIQCAKYSNSSSEVLAAYNSANHTYNTLTDRYDGISHQKSFFHNGYLRCAFELDVQRNVSGNAFNLSNPYYLLLGAGWINETAKNTYELEWHLVKPSVSPSKIVFACGNKCGDEDFVHPDLNDIYGRCGKSHKCYGVPTDCVKDKSCLQLISYGAANKHGKIPIELYGTAPNSTYAHNFWVGFGASSSGGMDDTAVIQCAKYSNSSSEVLAAYNSANHTYNTLTDRHDGISHQKSFFHNGYLRCAFELDVQRNVSGNAFNLSNPYYLLLGAGWINETAKNTYELEWHLVKPSVSPSKIVFACGTKCGDEDFVHPDLNDIYGRCGKSHKCYGVPTDCVKDKSCLQLISYGAANKHGKIPIELYGTAPNSTYAHNFWVGFGASSSGGMDDTAVIQCAKYSNSSSEVLAAYNSANHTYNTLTDRHDGISHQKSFFHNGYLRCAFELDVQRNVSGNAFNLSNPYYLLLGAGWINETANNKYELEWHLVKPSISPSKIVFSCGNKCGDEAAVDSDLSDIYGRCGKSHKCYGVPTDCVATKACLQLISYGSANKHGKLPIQLFGTAPNSTYADNFWIGFGASVSGGMDDTAVIQCAKYPNASSEVLAAFNSANHTYQTLVDRHNGIHYQKSQFHNGYLRCGFELDVERNVMGNAFNLSTPYFLLLGAGWINQTGTNTYDLKWHLVKPTVTDKKIVFACGNKCGDESSEDVDLNDIYGRCGKSHKCYGVPADCVATKACLQLISYAAANKHGKIPMELYGTAPNSTYADNFWVGFGASSSGGMDDTAVVQCAKYSNSSSDVLAAYNSPNHTYNSLTDRHNGIHHQRSFFHNGYLRCAFELDVERNVTGNAFNLSNPYYLLLGAGWINETSKNNYELKWHVVKPTISASKIVFACGNKCGTEISVADGIYDQCGKSRQCFGFPDGCINSLNCTQLLSYGSSQSNTSKIPVDLYGTSAESKHSDSFWIGFGLSLEGKMADTAVIQCARYPNDVSEAVAGYNSKGHHYATLKNRQSGISNVTTSFVNGFIRCSFDLDVELNVEGDMYDLNTAYYLLVGSGSVKKDDDANDDDKYKLKKHFKTPHKVPNKVVMGCGNHCPSVLGSAENGFGVPEGCMDSGNCDMLVRWNQVPNQKAVIQVSLTGVAPNVTFANNFWIGFGVSPTTKMENTAVVQCVRYSSDFNDVIAAYNPQNYKYQQLANSRYGISDAVVSFADGILNCTFHLDVVRSINNATFDMKQYLYVKLGSGWVMEQNGSYAIRKHVKTPKVSSQLFALAYETDNCTSQPSTPAPPITTTSATQNDVYNQCGKSRRCFGFPENCVASLNCTQLLSYGASQGDSNKVPIDLYGTAPDPRYSNSFWVGFGLSLQGNMEYTAVTQCARYPSDQNEVVAGYNSKGHSYSTLAKRQNGISEASTSFVNGFVRCSFNLDVSLNVVGNMYDLNTPYYLLVGSGYVDAGANNTYILKAHLKYPHKIPNKVALACGNQCPPAPCTGQNCFGVPEDCVTNGNCEMLVSWSAVPNQKDFIQVGISGGAPNATFANSFWVGFGVSPIRAMGNTAVIQCVRYPNDTNDVITAYNSVGHRYEQLNDSRFGISDVVSSFTDGQLNCTFQMDVVRNISNATFDLRQYLYVKLGSGWVMEQNGSYIIRKHVKTPKVSSNLFALACETNNCTYQPTTIAPPFSSTTAPQNSTGVFGYPENCEGNACQIEMTFGSSKSNDSRASLVLRGKPDQKYQGLFWIAIGIAPGAAMDDAMVFECVSWSDGNKTRVDLFGSYNFDDNTNKRTGQDGLYLTSSSYADGVLTCAFDSDVVRNITGITPPKGANLTFDLTQPYHLLLAEGPIKPGTTNDKDIHDHKIFSSGTVIVTNSSGHIIPSDGAKRQMIRKAHAIFMVLAWLMFASMGILSARHSKDMWPDKLPCGVKMWFALHRFDMISAVVCTIIGIFLIFFGENWTWSQNANAHVYVGLTTFTLAMIQPFIALFRPHPGTPKRTYFNYFHWTVGYSTLLLSGATMFLGASLGKGYLELPEAAKWIIVGCFGVNLILQIVLEIYKATQASAALKKSESQANLAEKQDAKPLEPLEPNDVVRYTILVIDWIILGAGTLVVVVLIGISP